MAATFKGVRMTKIIDLDIKLNIDGVANPYRAAITSAVSSMKTVLESDSFYNQLVKAFGESNKLEGELSGWKNSYFYQIYNAYLGVYHIENDKIFGSISLELCTYYNRWTKAMGEGGAGNKIMLNTKFLTTDVSDIVMQKVVGSLVSHESGHKQPGFEHDFSNTRRRKNSICYLINTAYKTAFDEIFGVPESTIKLKTPWYKRLWNWIAK